MSARGRPHDADAVGVESERRGLGTDHSDRTLQILPGTEMLLRAVVVRTAIAHRHDGHTLFVKIAAERRDFEAVRRIPVICAAGIDDLNRLGLEFLREMPLDPGIALVRERIRHLALGPDILTAKLREIMVLIGRITEFERNFLAELAVIVHLADKTERTFLPVATPETAMVAI